MFGFRRPHSFNAAMNALMAENYLDLVELVPENPQSRLLGDALLRVFAIGGKGFDSENRIDTFNHLSRVEQLGFVAMALNELGEKPLVRTADWNQVRNPMVLPDIERGLDKARLALSRIHGDDLSIHGGALHLYEWGLGESGQETDPGSKRQTPESAPVEEVSKIFMANFPDPDTSSPAEMVRVARFTVLYYENSKSMGEKLGVPGFMAATKTAVVSEDERPVFVFRYEQGPLGGFAFVKVETDGATSNYGPLDSDTEAAFLEKVRWHLYSILAVPALQGGAPTPGGGMPMSEENMGLMQQFPNAATAIEYIDEVKEAWDRVHDFPQDFVEMFLRALDENPACDAKELADKVEVAFGQVRRPFASDAHNEALENARALSPEAEAEYLRVVTSLGETVDPNLILAKVEAKYPSWPRTPQPSDGERSDLLSLSIRFDRENTFNAKKVAVVGDIFFFEVELDGKSAFFHKRRSSRGENFIFRRSSSFENMVDHYSIDRRTEVMVLREGGA